MYFLILLRNKALINPFMIIILTSALILMTTSFIMDPIDERLSGFKLTQYNLGINDVSYWLSFYISHWVYF